MSMRGSVLSRGNLVFLLAMLMIFCAPWYASGKHAIALLVLEVLGGIQLLILATTHRADSRYGLNRLIWLFIILLLLGTAFYLTPLSTDTWRGYLAGLHFILLWSG